MISVYFQLHPLARQFLSKKASARRTMSSQALQDMERAKRELDSLEEGLQAYTVSARLPYLP